MRFKLFACITLSSLALNSCGVFGDKNAPNANSNVSATGCLNESKNLVSRYLDGAMSQSEWKSAFDCINTSLDFFTDFVRGSAVDSYSQGDMYTLITKFLITNGKVRKDLMKGAFNLKMALFGGDVREFKKEEIVLLKNALGRLRDITGDLIPYLQLRQDPNASLDQILEMIPAFKRAGDQLADFINTLPTGIMSSDAMDLLFKEMTYTLDLTQIDDIGEKVSIAKWLMFNTRRDAFESYDWAHLFRSAFGLGGIFLAMKTATGKDPLAPRAQIFNRLGEDYHFREFALELLQQARPYIDESLAQHHGSTPLPIFEHLIDELPAGMMDNVPKNVLKDALRPFVLRLLQSDTQLGVDKGVVNTLYGVVESMTYNLGLLDRFYEKTGLDIYSVTPEVMSAALNQYEESLSGETKVAFAHVKKALMIHQPMIDRDTGFVRYVPNLGYSKLQHQMVIAFDGLVRFIHSSYGSATDHFIESDFITFFDRANFTPVLFAFKLIDETVADFGKKRFQDLDLFTSIGNGDKKATIPEVVSYAILLMSSGKMTSKMKTEIGAACPEDRGVDLMGTRWISPTCFRTQFHERLPYWLDNFPRMKAYWQTLSQEDKVKSMKWLEHGARRNGYTFNAPASGSTPARVAEDFGAFDFQSMATVLHYTESLFTRFDMNINESLSKTEVNSAYSLFKILIQKKAKETVNISIGNDYLLKAIFTYIVKYRSMPALDSFGNGAQLAWWLLVYSLPTTHYTADRVGIFNIVCQLAAPDSKAQADLTKEICVP